jgi:hypothetical protein
MRSVLLAGPLVLAASGRAAACAVCFGNAPGAKGLLDGIWWGIILLLTATMSMVAGIGYALYSVERSRLAAEERPS